jgi:hypothetical protein
MDFQLKNNTIRKLQRMSEGRLMLRIDFGITHPAIRNHRSQSGRSDKHDGLRGRYVKASPAADILAHQHIVDTNHVIAGILKSGEIMLVKMSRRLALFGTRHPSNIVVVTFAAKRAAVIGGLGFLPFIKDIFFVQHRSSTKKKSSRFARNLSQILKTENPRVVTVGELKIQRVPADHRCRTNRQIVPNGLVVKHFFTRPFVHARGAWASSSEFRRDMFCDDAVVPRY